MQLIGMLDSPYVRRVAITAQFLGIELEHRFISIFRDYAQFREINPLVKVPTLVCDDGDILVDSALIIDYLQSISAADDSLMPRDAAPYQRALKTIGVALVAMEKTVQLIYETAQRPEEKQHQPWIDRVDQQLRSAIEMLEREVANGQSWLCGDAITQADVSTAVAWRFNQHVCPERIDAEQFPGLVAFSARAEALPEFIAVPIDG